MILNFREIYKAANDQIQAPSEALERVLGQTKPAPKRINFKIMSFCAAVAAAVVIMVSTVYFTAPKDVSEPVKLMQANPKTELPENEASPYSLQKEASSQDKLTTDEGILQEGKESSQDYTAKSEIIEETPVSQDETPAFKEEIPSSEEKETDLQNESLDLRQTPLSVDDETVAKGSEAPEIISAAPFAAAVTQSDDNGIKAVSYNEYCDIIGFDIIGKAKLPEGVTLITPDEVYIDGNENAHTFYTSSDNTKSCYISVVSKTESEDTVNSSVSEGENEYSVVAETDSVYITAKVYGFTKDEANALAESLAN